MTVQTPAAKTIQKLEITRGKSRNLGPQSGKKWVLTISAKYLRVYEINHSIKESYAKKL